jgi:hypothetical protein
LITTYFSLPEDAYMTKFQFSEIKLFDPSQTKMALERRLAVHLHRLRGTLPLDESDDDFEYCARANLPEQDRRKIVRRVEHLIQFRDKVSGLAHLARDDKQRLERCVKNTKLMCIASEHQADAIAATIHEEMPWMSAANEILWHDMRRSVRHGEAGFKLTPVLLDGPPGIGKSYWARRVGALLSVPTTVIEATTENASFGIVGSQKGWGSAHAGRLLNTILDTQVGNPIMIVDEIEKAGTVSSSRGAAFGLSEALLPLLEGLTSRNWSCPYFQVKFDMSWVGWVLTSNDFRKLPPPLLSRCSPIRLRELTSQELEQFVLREGAKLGLSAPSISATVEALERACDMGHKPSIRIASRLLAHAETLEATPIRH